MELLYSPRIFLMVHLKSSGSIPNLYERLDTSEHVLIADSFLCMSIDNFLDDDTFRSIIVVYLKDK